MTSSKAYIPLRWGQYKLIYTHQWRHKRHISLSYEVIKDLFSHRWRHQKLIFSSMTSNLLFSIWDFSERDQILLRDERLNTGHVSRECRHLRDANLNNNNNNNKSLYLKKTNQGRMISIETGAILWKPLNEITVNVANHLL